ncbi:3147_t:CDS:1, partial [Diversispora eburnea]
TSFEVYNTKKNEQKHNNSNFWCINYDYQVNIQMAEKIYGFEIVKE